MAGNPIVEGSNNAAISDSKTGVDYSGREIFGNLYSFGSKVRGNVNLFHARIGGNVTIDDLTIEPDTKSLGEDGELNLGMVWLRGDLSIMNSMIADLNLDRMQVDGSVLLANNITSIYQLTGSQMGSIDFQFNPSLESPGIFMDSVSTDYFNILNAKIGNISCAKSCAHKYAHIEGCKISEFDLHDALFGEMLSLAHSTIESLSCDRLTVNEGDFNKNAYLDLRGAKIFSVDGSINLYGTYRTDEKTELPDEMWEMLRNSNKH